MESIIYKVEIVAIRKDVATDLISEIDTKVTATLGTNTIDISYTTQVTDANRGSLSSGTDLTQESVLSWINENEERINKAKEHMAMQLSLLSPSPKLVPLEASWLPPPILVVDSSAETIVSMPPPTITQ